MKLKTAAAAIGLFTAVLAAPASANAATHPNTVGFCSYNYAMWFGNPTGANAVHLSEGSSNGCSQVFVEIARLLPGGGKQIVAYGIGEATYPCSGTAVSTYQSVNNLDNSVMTMSNVACG